MAEVVDAAPRTNTSQDDRRANRKVAGNRANQADALRVEQAFGLSVCELDPGTWRMDSFTLPSSKAHCQEARARVDRVAEAMGVAVDARADIMLAVGEAVANAIEHGNGADPRGSFTVCCMGAENRFYVSVSDPGPGFRVNELAAFEEALLQERGRGIHCMNAVMDEVTFDFSGGTTVRMSLEVRS